MLRFERASRADYFAPMTRAWVLVSGAFALAVTGLSLLRRETGMAVPLCPVKMAAGLPCPFCGGTSATLLLASGDPGAALRTNPLVTLAIGGFALHFLLWAGFGLRPRLALRAPQVTVGILLLVAMNWAWVLAHH